MSIACTGASRKDTMIRMSSSASSPDHNSTSLFSKVGEKIADYKRQFMKSIMDLELDVESLNKNLKLLNAKASDVKDQTKSSMGPGGKKRKREVEEWLAQVKSIENEAFELGTRAESEDFIRYLMDGGKVAELNDEAVMLVEQSQNFDEFLLDTCGKRGVEFLTTGMVGEAFAGNVKRIWSLLEMGKVSSIGIYGMGGVGKTALAKCINNRLLEQSQVSVFWIGVSQEFTVKGLQDKIACLVGLDLSDECDIDVRAVKLHRALSQLKNSVLILDDLWEYIDLSKVGCPISAECCRLIITTRSLEVCRQIYCQKIIKVSTLCGSEAWELFIKSLTLKEKVELGPCEEIAKSLAALCGGLPLGIINVARNMRGKTSFHSWRSSSAELQEHMTGQGGTGDVEVFRVLKRSFDWLNNQSEEFNMFQLCFLHCSLYAHGSNLHRDFLVDRFISDGLVDGRLNRRARVHQGQSILDKLLNVCLLETAGTRVTMHGLVRGMALKIGEGKYMVRSGGCSSKEIPREEEWAECLEKVSLMDNGIESIQDGISPNCPKLSTLLLGDNPLKAIPNSFFSLMKGLSTLDLHSTHITALPDSVSDLTSLKTLYVGGCDNLEKVPYLGKLRALRELKLCYTAIKEIPPGVEELSHLELLDIDGVELEMLPKGLFLKLRHLQYLNVPYQVEVTVEEIENLKGVEHLSGRLKDVFTFNCLVKNQQGDAFYQVLIGKGGFDDYEGFEYYDREVYLSECNLEGEKLLGADVESLAIRECGGLSKYLSDDFSPPHYSKSLRVLTIRRCKGIEYILTWSRESPSHFPTLQTLDLDALDDFKGLFLKQYMFAAAPARAAFSDLRNLHISNCNKMRKLGLSLSVVPYIEEITILDCEEIEEVFEDEEFDSVSVLKLQELRLECLPRLRTLCEATVISKSITTICIVGCPRLTKKLPVDLCFPLLPTLKIEVERNWWESLEWENPSLPQLLKHTLLLT